MKRYFEEQIKIFFENLRGKTTFKALPSKTIAPTKHLYLKIQSLIACPLCEK